MKWNILYTVQPLKCRGIETGAAILGAGLVSSIGSGIAQTMAADSAQSQNAANRRWEASEYDRRFQMGEEQLIRSEERQSVEFDRRLSEVMTAQNAEYDRRMNVYETPAAKARLLQQAGFNPLSAVSDGASSPSVAAADVGSLSGVPVSSPSVPSLGQITPVDTGMVAMVQTISNGVKAFADAQKAGAETTEIQTMLKGKLEKLLAEAEGQKLLNASQDLHNLFNEKTFPSRVGKLLSEWNQDMIKETLMSKESELLDAKIWHEKALSILAEHQGDLTAEQFTQAAIRTAQYSQELAAYVANLKSQTALNNANVGVAQATKTQIENYNYIHGNPEVQRSIMEQFANESLQSALRNELTEKQISQLQYAVSQAAYADTMKEFTYWSNQVQGIVGTVGDVASKFFGAGLLGKVLGNGGSVPVAPPSASGPQVFRPFWQTNTQ